jgi:hypothetical protein
MNDGQVKLVCLKTLLAVLCLSILIPLGCGAGVAPPTPSPNVFDEEIWRDPPREFYPYVRWWWPGGAVDDAELRREIALFRDAGFGGVEIQPCLLGFTPADIEGDPDIRTVGTGEFFRKVGVAAAEADKRGMAFDFTLGSGWSSGGPFVSDAPETQLLMSSIDIKGPSSYEGPLPPVKPPSYRQIVNAVIGFLSPFDEDAKMVAVVAARVEDNSSSPPVLDSFTDITGSVEDGSLSWQVPGGMWRIFAFYRNDTGHQPVGGAYAGNANDSLIADHMDAAGAQELIEGYAEPLLEATGESPPNAVFVDSFEMVGELPWTTSLLERFRQSKGYDLTPYLPLVFYAGGESKYTTILEDMAGNEPAPLYVSTDDISARVREDYEEVRSDMFIEGFVEPVRDWAHDNGLLLRMQAHGGWADYLYAYELADIPGTEGLFAGGAYDFLKLASSAGHTAGRTYISSESFISVRSDPRDLMLEDFYLLAGRLYSAGINRIVYHCFPYRYIRENGSRWYGFPAEREGDMISAGPFPFSVWLDEEHPVWPDMPSFNLYLSRLCYAMSRGTHRADVAWLHQDRRFRDRVISNDGGYPPEQGESNVSISLKRSGLVYDRISRQGLEGSKIGNGSFTVGAAEYRALLLTNLSVASPQMMAAIESIADAGIPVLVIGDLPGRANGWVDRQQRDAAVQDSVERLESLVVEVDGADGLGAAIESAGVQPAVAPGDGGELAFAIDRRDVADGTLILLFNEADEEHSQVLEVHIPATRVRSFDPRTGEPCAEAVTDALGKLSIEVCIPARRSLVVVVEW